jgi:hypothetical protein
MKLNKYILTSGKLQGRLILTYADGFIKSLTNEFKGITEQQWDALVKELPAEEVNVSHLEQIGLKLKQDRINEKVALFCDHYKRKKLNSNPLNYHRDQPELYVLIASYQFKTS